MAEIAKIGAAKPDEALVEVCERLLDRAKSGELRSLAWAGTITGNAFITGMETDNAVEAAGLAYMMLHGIGHNRMSAADGD